MTAFTLSSTCQFLEWQGNRGWPALYDLRALIPSSPGLRYRRREVLSLIPGNCKEQFTWREVYLWAANVCCSLELLVWSAPDRISGRWTQTVLSYLTCILFMPAPSDAFRRLEARAYQHIAHLDTVLGTAHIVGLGSTHTWLSE